MISERERGAVQIGRPPLRSIYSALSARTQELEAVHRQVGVCNPLRAAATTRHACPCEHHHGVRRSISVLVESIEADVVVRVACLVIARVVLLAGNFAVDGGLFVRLDTFGTSEQTPSRDPNRNERSAIGPSAERGRFGRQTLRYEITLEDILYLRRTAGPRSPNVEPSPS